MKIMCFLIGLLILQAPKEVPMKTLIADATARNVVLDTDSSRGSGVIIQTHVIMTCFHILEAGSDIRLIDADGEAHHLIILAVLPKYDLCLLAGDTKEFERVKIAHEIEIGEQIFSVANPNGLRNFFAPGVVSHMKDNGFISTIPTMGGASGGGVYNHKGELVGITVAIITNNGFPVAIHIGQDILAVFIHRILDDDK